MEPQSNEARDDRPVVAFFDIDETLVAMKSPFELLRHRLAAEGDDGAAYEELVKPVRCFAAEPGRTPAEVSARFYEQLAGIPWDELLVQGRRWYAELRARGGVPFIEAPLKALRAHQRAGHLTVAVSGSWPASLWPLTDDLGFDEVYCTEPGLDERGRLDGTVRSPMFGPAKAEAVHAALAKYGAAAEDCHAYADDLTDLPMLRLVGRPTVVGERPEMAELAAEEGWATLPGTTVRGTFRRPV